jgi:hypothetical protein
MVKTALGLALALFVALACEGPAGPEGPPGNANVVSGTFSIAPTAYTNGFWSFPVDGGTQQNPAKVATMVLPALTADIVNNGAVLIYLKVPITPTGPSTHWTLLPFHQGGFGGGYIVSIKAAVQPGQIVVGYMHERTDTSVATPATYSATLPTYEFKYVGVGGLPAPSIAEYTRAGDPERVIQSLLTR